MTCVKFTEEKSLLSNMSEVTPNKIDEQILKESIINENDPFYLPPFLINKGYYTEGTAIYYPLKALEEFSQKKYYIKINRVFPKGNSKKTYTYCYYEKTENIELHTPYKTELSPYEYLNTAQIDELDKNDKTGNLVKALNKYLGFKSLEIPAYKDNSEVLKDKDEKQSGFVKKNLLNIKNDLTENLHKNGWITGLKEDYNPQDYITQKEKTLPLEIDEEKVTQQAETLINGLKNKEIDIIPFIKNRAKWLNAGELENTLTGFIAYFSTYIGNEPINFILIGNSAQGKTVIYKSAQQLMPPEAFENGRKTEAVMYRLSSIRGINYLNHKVLLFGDLGGSKDLNNWEPTLNICKELHTDGEVKKELTGDSKDKDTGEKQLLNLKLTGHPSLSLTTIHTETIDDQLRNRGLMASPKATDKNVKIFHRYNRGKYEKQRNRIIKEDIETKLHSYIRYLKMNYPFNKEQNTITDKEGNLIDFINPYHYCYEDWINPSEFYKRNSKLYENIINAIALLNVPFREQIMHDRINYIVIHEDDIRLVSDLLDPANALTDLAILLFNKLLDWYNDNDYDDEAKKEYSEYSQFGGNLKDYKHIFTAGMINHKVGSISKLKNMDISLMLQNLAKENKIKSIGNTRNRDKNIIYMLNEKEKIKSVAIDLDQEKINKWCREIKDIYEIDLEPPIISSETTKDIDYWKTPKW